MHVLQKLLGEHGRLVDLFENEAAALRPQAEEDSEQILAGFAAGSIPFGVDSAAYRQCYLDRLDEMRRQVAGGEQ